MKKTKYLLIALLIPAAFDFSYAEYSNNELLQRGIMCGEAKTIEECEALDRKIFEGDIEERRREQEEARRNMEEHAKNHKPKVFEQDICSANAKAAFAEIMGMKSISGVLYFTHEKESCESFKLITRYPNEKLCNSFGEFSKIVPPSADAIADCERAKQCNYNFCK
ncbi:TPA: hypothetical protein ONB34_006616 [Pseudomonas aeruginosa]|nr:hypothetical protein [Pseudomonas aeruginosa]HCR1467932.1 hypothetical protein [Pseudomonas aeruginosa]HCR1474180.1 hypothetical protein [Pseudomonas aeruginosa]HCR1802799.1 hypothetical protein [Pseudomonas aeruginosa]